MKERSTYHWVCHWADPSIDKCWVLGCRVHWQGVEKGPTFELKTTKWKYYFERLPKRTRVSPVLWTAALASLPFHWGFGKRPMKLEELLHLLLVQGVRQRTVPHLHLKWNFDFKILKKYTKLSFYSPANLSMKPRISWLDLVFQAGNSREP